MARENLPPVIGFCAYSGTGKTTLLKQLIPLLQERGIRAGLIKHSHHDFDIDVPGKDSYELRKAGAQQVVIGSSYRYALIHENSERREPTLKEMLAVLNTSELDLVLVEGFRQESFPKIEIHRQGLGKPTRYQDDQHIVAIATDSPFEAERDITTLDLNDVPAIAQYIEARFIKSR